MPTAIDVHGFGGGFTLGVVQAGFNLKAKYSREVGFGVLNVVGNRQLLPGAWDSVAAPVDEWDAMPADLVFGNPPCSGFSLLTSAKGFRGDDSPINAYMWEVIHYAARVKPTMVVWESVQQTFRQGLGLMRRLHAALVEESGLPYKLTHVLHNNASVGGVAIRRRYFWVASLVPFGIESGIVTPQGEHKPLTYVPSLNDMLKDLEPLGLTWARQPYRGLPMHTSEWCRREIHDGTGTVDGHECVRNPGSRRALSVFDPPFNMKWDEGEPLVDVLKRCYQQHGTLPPEWQYRLRDGSGNTKQDALVASGFIRFPNDVMRWYGHKMSRVVTGGAANSLVHPNIDRMMTQREVARIQGFPDAWNIWPVRDATDLGPGWGKGVPVQAGRWIAHWAHRAIKGHAGADEGVDLETYDAKRLFKAFGPYAGERVCDVTNDYQALAREQLQDFG